MKLRKKYGCFIHNILYDYIKLNSLVGTTGMTMTEVE